MATSGALNGTGIFVAMDSAIPGISYTQIGGQNSHTLTLNNQTIDITNKSSSSFRELLPDEGLQSIDLSLELVFNSEVTFGELKTLAGSKGDASFQISRSTDDVEFVGMCSSWAETSPDNDKLTAAVTILSTDTITWA